MRQRDSRLAGRLGLAFCLAASAVCPAQSALPQTAEEALQILTNAAGVVFTGTVTAVRRPAQPGGVVEIDFAVADAVRGVSGGSYTLREWAGLWMANDEPFRPGQRYLMLLHTPNSAGLSSPVGGPDGAIPIRGGAAAADSSSATSTVSPRVAAAHGTAITAIDSAGEATVDLGWIATRVVVPIAYTNRTTARPIPSPGVHAAAVLTDTPSSAQAAAGLPPAISADVRTKPYSNVIAMLRTWEANRNASR